MASQSDENRDPCYFFLMLFRGMTVLYAGLWFKMYVYNPGVSFNRYTYFINFFFACFTHCVCMCVRVYVHICLCSFWPLFLDILSFYFLNLLRNLLMVSVVVGVFIFTFENYEIFLRFASTQYVPQPHTARQKSSESSSYFMLFFYKTKKIDGQSLN